MSEPLRKTRNDLGGVAVVVALVVLITWIRWIPEALVLLPQSNEQLDFVVGHGDVCIHFESRSTLV